MMGRQSGQISMLILDIEELIPENHLLRKINQMISFDFIYDLVASYYPTNGRPSVDPVSMFKMLLVGYLYGIKSERRLVQEIQLNIAYRWFCGYELGEKIPDHSTFSKTRVRKWNESNVFQQIFLEIVRCCIEQRLVDGKEMAADGSYIPAEVSRNSWIDVEVEVEQSMLSYLDDLNQELASQPGFKKPPSHTVTKKITTSTTDRECGYIHHGSKRGVGYLLETTVDCKHGIVTGVDVFPANEKESLLILRHLEQQQKLLGLSMEKVALDRGYDTGAVHRGLELLGITGYIPAIRFPNDPSKYGFSYDPQQDTFICPMGQSLVYHRLNCNKSTGKYLRCYQVQGDICKKCPSREGCFDTAGARRRILASSCYPAFYRGHLRVNTPEYLHMMRKRKIWAEGSFATMKREHNLSTIHKRGILAATEECLLSAMALNLKRMVKAVFSAVFMDEIWAENMISQPIRYLCQQVQYLTLPGVAADPFECHSAGVKTSGLISDALVYGAIKADTAPDVGMFSKYVLHAFHGAHAFFTHGPCQDNGACRLNATVLDAADDRKDLSHRPGIVAHGRPIKNIALPPAIHDSAQGVHRIQVGFQQQSGGTGRPGKRSQHIACMGLYGRSRHFPGLRAPTWNGKAVSSAPRGRSVQGFWQARAAASKFFRHRSWHKPRQQGLFCQQEGYLRLYLSCCRWCSFPYGSPPDLLTVSVVKIAKPAFGFYMSKRLDL